MHKRHLSVGISRSLPTLPRSMAAKTRQDTNAMQRVLQRMHDFIISLFYLLMPCRMLPSKGKEVSVSASTSSEHNGPAAGSTHQVVYFAYGSNMNPKVFTDRRKVQPTASKPAVLEGHVLSFRLPGIPFVEPGMGTIEL